MDLPTAKDAASVQALLEKLRSSQALQQTISKPSTEAIDTSPVPPVNSNDRQAGPSVASLLSQLQASSHFQSLGAIPAHNQALDYVEPRFGPPHDSTREPQTVHSRPQDLRSCNFQQALPLIAQLSEDPRFIEAIRTMKHEQAQLEKRLWEERQSIQRKHEERVKVARNRATMIGAALTQFEADSMTDSFRRELRKFDAERVLPAWDGLMNKQQGALESLGVPTMYQTSQASDRERQQKIIQVLSGIVD